METTRLCPQCQQPLAADAPSGLCPQCLLKAAAGPPPSASGVGLADDFIDIGDPAEVARKLPQFEILEMLGRGGMGVVYKARQRNLDRIVALKILPPGDATSPDFVARFTREARALAKLNHPNIVNVHDFGETGGLYYIIMEHVDGMNLRQLLQTRRLTPAEALAIVPKICDALEYAHEEGLVHRDIKPENLLLDKKGRVKIADFGLAKLLRREALDMTLTLSGMALGTLRYMAPEQMDKPETVDHRADLYSLGVVIYEMLTGELPVGRFELPSQKAQVDTRLDDIVLHALEKEPAQRYQHASEVRTDVEKVTSKPQATAGTPKASPQATRSEPAHANEETTPQQLTPLPRFFHLRFFVLLLLGWGAVLALWNFGPIGVLAGATIMAAIALEIARTYALRQPRTVELLRTRSLGTRYFLISFNLLVCILVFVVLISGLFLLWDTSARQRDWPAESTEQFEAKYKGKEYQLIRNLMAFKDQVPSVELDTDVGGTSFSDWPAGPMAWVFIGYGVLALFFIFHQSAGEQRSIWWLNRGRWRSAFAGTGIVIASFLGVWVAVMWITMEGRIGHPVGMVTRGLDGPDFGTLAQVSTALRNWAAENGYTSTQHRWSLQTVPKGETAAWVEVIEAWKDSPFDRWQMSRTGLNRPYPHLHVQLTGTEKPVETAMQIYCAGSMVEVDSGKWKRWQAILASAVKAVREKAPGIDTKKPTDLPTITQGTGQPFPWPSAFAVLAAAMGWAFLRVRLGSLPTAPSASMGKADIAVDEPSVGQSSNRPRKVRSVVLALLAVAGFFIVLTRLYTHGYLAGTIFDRSEPPIDPPPPLGPMAGGIGATFTVPAGQVATFEIVTRSNNATVPISGLAAYVLAPSSCPVAGTFRWSPKAEENWDGHSRRRWTIELVTGGGRFPGGGGFSGGNDSGGVPDLPEGLDSAVGSRSYNWSLLPRDRETIDWAIRQETDNLPANGLIGFRVRTQGYEPAPGMGAGPMFGVGSVDWRKGLKMHSIKEETSLKPSASAADLLRKVSEKYGALSTFSATGKIVSIQTPASGGVAATLEKTFSLNLARPEFYRVQWTDENPGVGKLTGWAWSAGDGHKIMTYDKVTTYLNREQAVAAATGSGGGVAFTVPNLFFKDEAHGLDKILTNGTMLPEESVGADLCYVVSGDNHGNHNYKNTFWITKKDLFLKQSRSEHAANSGAGTIHRGEQLSDETVRKIIKANGREGTPEEVSKLKKQMESGRQSAEARQWTSTTTFETIAANGFLIKEDFEVTVPAAVPAQQPPAK